MPDFSLASLPEVFVSDSTISKAVYDAVSRRQLRKLGTRLGADLLKLLTTL